MSWKNLDYTIFWLTINLVCLLAQLFILLQTKIKLKRLRDFANSQRVFLSDLRVKLNQYEGGKKEIERLTKENEELKKQIDNAQGIGEIQNQKNRIIL